MRILVCLALLLCLSFGHAQARIPLEQRPVKFGTIYSGDSILDVGSNMLIDTGCRCDYVPYATAKFEDPSGRCSDGRLIPDFINAKLNLPEPKPYLQVKDDAKLPPSMDLASGGSGLFDSTNSAWRIITFKEQMSQLGEIANKLTEEELQNQVIFISIGGNDISVKLPKFRTEEELSSMIETYRGGIRQLYDDGYRKLVIMGVGPMGCTLMGGGNEHTGCMEPVNAEIRAFNSQVESMTSELTNELSDMQIAYFDGYKSLMALIHDGATHGFTNTAGACCPLCLHHNTDKVCSDPSKYVFFDEVHPTEHAYEILAESIFNDHVAKMIKPSTVKASPSAPPPSHQGPSHHVPTSSASPLSFNMAPWQPTLLAVAAVLYYLI